MKMVWVLRHPSGQYLATSMDFGKGTSTMWLEDTRAMTPCFDDEASAVRYRDNYLTVNLPNVTKHGDVANLTAVEEQL